MKLFAEPEDEGEIPDLKDRAGRLQAAYDQGKRFLVLPAGSGKEEVEWILASFLSPLAVVPVPKEIPAAERQRMLEELPPHWVEVKDLPDSAGRSIPKDLSEIWAVIFSSGSSGRPKAVALSGRALKLSADAHVERNGKLDWLLNLPLFHVGGFSILSRAHFLGTAVACGSSRFDAHITLRWIQSGKVQGLSLVPTTLKRIHEQRPDNFDFSALRTVLLGGAPAPGELREKSLAAGIPVRETYGLTECASQAATATNAGEDLLPVFGVELRLREGGEIGIKAPFLADGYFRQGNLEPLPLLDGFFFTGDLGVLSGGLLTVTGRKSDLIISGGLNIFPSEVENHLAGFPGIQDLAVVGLPDPEWGERVCLAWSGDDLDPDTVRAHLADRLDKRKWPRSWVKLSGIPRSSLGKVLRREVRELALKILSED